MSGDFADYDLLSERDQITESAFADAGDSEGSAGKPRTAIIRTSDRILFKRCRRRWAWQSHLRHNLGPIKKAAPLWLGSGIHFALEDYHADKLYPTAAAAFEAYCKASLTLAKKQNLKTSLPEDFDELVELGTGMMDYYELWLRSRDPLRTYIFNGVPQVEVNFKIRLPWPDGLYDLDEVYYSGQIDRVIQDDDGMLWLVEYKTAKAIQTNHYLTDPQVTSYCWAASCVYDAPVAGVIYQQHRKTLPKDPRILANGSVSVAENQITSHRAYREALIKVYGGVQLAPKANIDYLNNLADREQPAGDPFIRRDRLFRNRNHIEAEGEKILAEAYDMLNPDLPLYPNPTRTCSFDCTFGSACVSLDDGSDFEYELEQTTARRDTEYDTWRKYLAAPQPVPPFNQEPPWLQGQSTLPLPESQSQE
jgi:hypothetical protein